MTIEVHGYPTQFFITSESDEGQTYIVWLTDPHYLVGGEFNGSCSCNEFKYRCGPSLRKEHNTCLHRCKHIRACRDGCLDILLHALARNDPNGHHDANHTYET